MLKGKTGSIRLFEFIKTEAVHWSRDLAESFKDWKSEISKNLNHDNWISYSVLGDVGSIELTYFKLYLFILALLVANRLHTNQP